MIIAFECAVCGGRYFPACLSTPPGSPGHTGAVGYDALLAGGRWPNTKGGEAEGGGRMPESQTWRLAV